MANAYNGTGAKRKPISVREVSADRYEVVDGNSTTAIAKKNGWKGLPVLIVQEEDFKPGTVRKWQSGTVIKDASGEWVPYQSKDQHQKLVPARRAVPASELTPEFEKLGGLQASGKLPGNTSPAEHLKIAETFLKEHQDNLAACVDRISSVAVGADTAIMARTKAPESALGKLIRKPKYGTADNLKDGTGVRIVCQSIQDVLANVAAIKDRFEVSKADEEDYINQPKDGYRSYHLVIKDDDDLWKEVQIRTPNQDTWAHWCHDVYKPVSAEQSAAVAASKDKILQYGESLSEYYYAKDSGKKPPPPPDCPPVVKTVFGCLPT
jgi:ppGpp synthetase/RelA/SpoT-type nucleotidyltranferase